MVAPRDHRMLARDRPDDQVDILPTWRRRPHVGQLSRLLFQVGVRQDEQRHFRGIRTRQVKRLEVGQGEAPEFPTLADGAAWVRFDSRDPRLHGARVGSQVSRHLGVNGEIRGLEGLGRHLAKARVGNGRGNNRLGHLDFLVGGDQVSPLDTEYKHGLDLSQIRGLQPRLGLLPTLARTTQLDSEQAMPDQTVRSIPPDQQPQGAASRYIVGEWSHIFTEGGAPTDLRIAFDTTQQRIVAMQLHTARGYVDAGRADMADVQESLLTANAHVLADPAAEGFALEADLPAWSAPEARNLAVTQFEREIVFCKVQHGLLIGELALELEAGGDDAQDEFRWDVVDSAKGNLAAAAANAATDDPADQENAIAGAEAWIAEHISGGALDQIIATSIALTSANETQAAVFEVLAASAPKAAQ